MLSTKVAGMPSLIQDGVNGKLIDPNSIEQLVTGIQALTLDHSNLERFATNAKRTLREGFDFNVRMKKVVDVYKRLGLSHRIPPETCNLTNNSRTNIGIVEAKSA